MENITQENVTQLLTNDSKGLRVTIYIPMPASASPPQMSEKQLRFKNLMNQAIESLEVLDPTGTLAKELAGHQTRIQDDMDLWKHQTAGMLVCASTGTFKTFNLPYDTEEYVSVADSFYLAPVLSILGDAQDYYVLTVVQQGPKLFQGDMYGLHETHLELPYSATQARRIDEPNQKSENQGSATGSSMNTAWFNGRGGTQNPQENDRIQFFRIIDTAVNHYIHGNAPLILAGIEAEIAEYRAVSKHFNILTGHISGSHGDARPFELTDAAAAIIDREITHPLHQAAIEDYEHMHGANPKRAAADEATISQAVEQGRVDKLLFRMTRRTSDVVRDTLASAKRITFHDHEKSQKLNELAIKVWQASGKVIGMEESEMPANAPMLARMRY